MASVASVSSVASTNSLDIKPIVDTYRVYAKYDENGKIIADSITYGTAGKDNAWWNKMDGDKTYTLRLEQTVKFSKAGTWEGAALLVEDADERVNIFNKGAMSKQTAKLKALFTAANDDGTDIAFEPVDGYLDMTDALNEPTQRRFMTDSERAQKNMMDSIKAMMPHLTPEQVREKVALVFATLGQ